LKGTNALLFFKGISKGLLPLAPATTTFKNCPLFPWSSLRFRLGENSPPTNFLKLLIALATPTLRQWVKVSLHENLLTFKNQKKENQCQ